MPLAGRIQKCRWIGSRRYHRHHYLRSIVAEHGGYDSVAIGTVLDIGDVDGGQRVDAKPRRAGAIRLPQTAELHRNDRIVVIVGIDCDRLHHSRRSP